MATEAQIKRIIELRTQDIPTDTVARDLNISRNIVCKEWWNYDSNGMYQHLAPTPPPEKIIPLEQWQAVSQLPQADEWQAVQAKFERDHRYLIVEHDNDNHFPFHDVNAQAMRSKVRQALQPHIIVVGSDAADFPTISRFESDSRLKDYPYLRRFRQHWIPHVNQLSYDAPNAALIWIDGNHDERAWLTIERSENYELLFDFHVATIKASNRVYWRGTHADALEVVIADTLIVTHGWKATVHTASAMLREYHNQYSVLAGHSHTPDFYTRGTRYQVSAVIGGCGCDLNPHYDRRKKRNRWQHGYSYAIVDTLTQTAITKHIDFVHTQDTLWCALDNEILRVDKQQIQEQAA